MAIDWHLFLQIEENKNAIWEPYVPITEARYGPLYEEFLSERYVFYCQSHNSWYFLST